MFSLRTTELKASLLGSACTSAVILCGVWLLNHISMPTAWRFAYFLLACLIWMILVARHFLQSNQAVGIDELGAYLHTKGHRYPLTFVRFNSLQLIARYPRSRRVLDVIWPAYCLIYKDSLPTHAYSILRSFAAQQKLLGDQEHHQ